MSVCILGFVFSLRTTFVGVLLSLTFFRVVSALSTIPTFNRILVLVLLLSVLSLLSLLPSASALAVLAFALFALALPSASLSIGSSSPGCDEPFCFTFRAFASSFFAPNGK